MKKLPILLVLALSSCSSKDDAKTAPPTVAAENEKRAPAARLATMTVASVHLQEDCPDSKQESPQTPAEPSSERPGDSGLHRPCTQSRMQLSFVGHAAPATNVRLREVRLLVPDGETLAILEARMPSIWKDQTYQPWAESIDTGDDLQVSYKLSVPDWSEIETKTGGRSFGTPFLLEIELEIAGETRTVRSGEFARQQPVALPT